MGVQNALHSLIYAPDLFITRRIFVINSLAIFRSRQNSWTHNDALLSFLSPEAWAVRRVCVTGVLYPSKHDILIQCWVDVGQRRRWWTNIKSTLVNICVISYYHIFFPAKQSCRWCFGVNPCSRPSDQPAVRLSAFSFSEHISETHVGFLS